MSPATLPRNATWGASPGSGREAQSIAFLSTAVMAVLYSGELTSQPLCSISSRLNSFAFVGNPWSRSISPS